MEKNPKKFLFNWDLPTPHRPLGLIFFKGIIYFLLGEVAQKNQVIFFFTLVPIPI